MAIRESKAPERNDWSSLFTEVSRAVKDCLPADKVYPILSDDVEDSVLCDSGDIIPMMSGKDTLRT